MILAIIFSQVNPHSHLHAPTMDYTPRVRVTDSLFPTFRAYARPATSSDLDSGLLDIEHAILAFVKPHEEFMVALVCKDWYEDLSERRNARNESTWETPLSSVCCRIESIAWVQHNVEEIAARIPKEWLKARGIYFQIYFMYQSPSAPDWKWLIDHNCVVEITALAANGWEVPFDACMRAIQRESPEILTCFLNRGCPWGKLLCSQARRYYPQMCPVIHAADACSCTWLVESHIGSLVV